MEATPENLQVIMGALEKTLDPVYDVRKQAENTLSQGEKVGNFSVILLQIVGQGDMNPVVRKAGALYFKNFVKKYWKQVEGEPDFINETDRNNIKAAIVRVMISVPRDLQAQLSEAISMIADNDFPFAWANLLEDLLANLNPNDYNVNIGVLQTAHSIFRRYRHQFASDRLFAEIKFVLDTFAAPYLQFFLQTDALITANANNKEALKPLMQCLLLLFKIFWSLNSQEFAEFFEDHYGEFVGLMRKYLVYMNPEVDDGDEDEPGVLEKIKTVICEVAHMYASKYAEDFKDLKEFVELVWKLVIGLGPQQKNDLLVSKAIAFLTVVVRQLPNKPIFENPEALNNICQNVVLPNMQLRESDVEQFEDDPIEYIRKDLEGDDTESRRRAASDLIKGLLEHFKKEVSQICMGYIQGYLAQYERNKLNEWRSKDAALYLIMSLSAQSSTVQAGATKTNEFVPILPVLETQVLPDLQVGGEGGIHPIIKVDAIKYLVLFRSQLDKQVLSQIFPALLQHLGSDNYVVYTYAAICIEKILGMKVESGGRRVLMFNQEDVAPVAQALLTRLFQLIEGGKTPEKVAENDYLMKTVMRLIAIAREETLPYVTNILDALTRIIGEISKNPSNPKFNHYAFESLGGLIRFICAKNPALVTSFEDALFPRFEAILAADVVEFMPYVFQLSSQLLEYHQGLAVPDKFKALLPLVLTPALWESTGNIPALVKLLKAYVAKGSGYLVESNLLVQVLGVCRKLVGSKANDQHGFELLTVVFEVVPTSVLAEYLKPIFILFLTRLQSSKTSKFSSGFLNFLCFLCVVEKEGWGVDAVFEVLDGIQPGIFTGLSTGVLIPEVGDVKTPDDRKLCGVGLTNLLTRSERILGDGYIGLWPTLFTATINLINKPIADQHEDDDPLANVDLEDVGYQTQYSRLASSTGKKRDYVAHVTDVKRYFVEGLAGFVGGVGLV
ncbi:importin-alpha export receptor [Rhizophlyctis rosea]|uniref:Importin-alpha export receptor n=1 Tax=Rhizophlyctis rosea TaxID=64517 RepID=A0AAD5SH83_9FUNG|nr:importin-alpha export receptor [Rhizophlyctis rosea]